MARTRSTKKVKGGWENAKLVQWYFKERKKKHGGHVAAAK